MQSTNYTVFHINRVQNIPTAEPEDDTDNDDLEILEDPDLYEWELLSQMGASNNLNIDDLDMLGKRDIDINYSWNTNNVCHQLDESATTFISKGKLDTNNIISAFKATHQTFQLGQKQQLALDIIIKHWTNKSENIALCMIIQGITGTGKSYLIHCIREIINTTTQNGKKYIASTSSYGCCYIQYTSYNNPQRLTHSN